MQIGAELLCKGAKVEAGKITEYRSWRHEVGEVEAGKITEYGVRRTDLKRVTTERGTGDREGCVAGTSGRRPQHSPRRLGWHAVPTLPEATRTARGAVPTSRQGRSL